MRTTACLLLCILFVSCSPTTSGWRDENQPSTEPIVFLTSLSRPAAMTTLKRVLVMGGFIIADQDTGAGVMSSSYKTLSEKERMDIGSFTAAFLSVKDVNQAGRVAFVFTRMDDTTETIQLRCLINVTADAQITAYATNTSRSGDVAIAQGHPFAMGMKEAILREQGFRLVPDQAKARERYLWQQKQLKK